MAVRINSTGRNRKTGKHVRLYEHVLSSDAYRHLDVYSRSLLIEFMRRYNGTNNSQIHMSYRDAANLVGCSQKPIRRAFDVLQERGFIKVAKKGAFSVKLRHATEWELTEFPVGNALPTKEFMRWESADLEANTKNSRRTQGTGSAYPKLKVVNKNVKKHTDGVPRGYREANIGGSHGVPRVHTYSIPCNPSVAQASGPSKGQAQSCAGSTVIPFKENAAQVEVLNAVGGLCKISHLPKDVFLNLVSIQETKQLSGNQIRSLAIQAKIKTAGAA